MSKADTYRDYIARGEFREKTKASRFRKSLACEENRLKILQFDSENLALGRSDHTRMNYLIGLHSFAEWLGEKKFEEVSKEDIINYINYLGSKGLEESSINIAKARIRKFYLWLNGGDEYPRCVSWIRSKMNYTTISPDEILSEEEIRKMIEVADNFRDKAIIACLYESACRIAEFLNVKIMDLTFDEFGVKMKVNGKTGERVVRLVNSLPYLKEWLKRHPKKENPQEPLWVNISKYQKWNSERGYGARLSYNGISSVLKKCASKAGIKKRVHPHILRHSRLTHLASKIKESYLRKIAGWTADSSMVRTYVHLSDKDVDNAILEKVYGMKIESLREMEEKLLPKTCWNCGEKNPFDVDFCLKCKFPLDENAVKLKEKQFLAMLTPEIIEKMIEKKIEQLIAARARR